jgi:hypothetical protein
VGLMNELKQDTWASQINGLIEPSKEIVSRIFRSLWGHGRGDLPRKDIEPIFQQSIQLYLRSLVFQKAIDNRIIEIPGQEKFFPRFPHNLSGGDSWMFSNKFLERWDGDESYQELEPVLKEEAAKIASFDIEMIGCIYENLIGCQMEMQQNDEWSIVDSIKRKARGAYYTPPDVIKHLLEKSLRITLNERRSLKSILNLRVLDPAMGSGFFLLGALRMMSEGRNRKTRVKIAKDCLHGVDFDSNTSELAKALLWLEVGDVTFSPAELNNIRYGDSLLGPGPDSQNEGQNHETGHGFDWSVQFSEIFNRKNPGFDCIIGNPPWKKIKADAREFSRFTSSFSTKNRSADELEQEWKKHKNTLKRYRTALKKSESYKNWFQSEKGSMQRDVELYQLFLVRSYELLRGKGRLSFVLPSGFYQSQGNSMIRRRFFDNGYIDYFGVFINEKSIFPIHKMFKFVLIDYVKETRKGPIIENFNYGLTSIDSEQGEPSITFEKEWLENINQNELYLVPELISEKEKDLFTRISTKGQKNPRPAEWVKPVREYDMSKTKISLIHAENLSEEQIQNYQDSADYWPVYEGRMVNQYDSAAKTYIEGQDRSSIWKPLGYKIKSSCRPQYWMGAELAEKHRDRLEKERVGFCDIAGHDNERTIQAAIIPPNTACGNKVPTIIFEHPGDAMIWLALANSFTIDWWARKIVSTTLNFFLLEEIPLAHIKRDSDVGEKLIECVRELTIRPTIPIEKNEMRTIRERAYLRARIDVEVAKYYKLTLEELLFLLNDFESLNERETVVELIQLVWNGAEETDTKIVKLLAKEKMPYVPQELAKILKR